MIKNIFITLLVAVSFLIFYAGDVNALVNPLAVENNKHGIHIVDENDLSDAAALVNSNGGAWGYVTVVIQENDRDITKWQRILDRMRKLKVIPIVRLATSADGPNWKKPKSEDVHAWVNFLSSLNWVVENRYVILFNEPNHAQEWQGTINPEEYATITSIFQKALKESSDDFYILPAGIDLAAGNTQTTMEATSFYKRIYMHDPEYFNRFDGWTSHSYPNPNFSGSLYDTGRTSIQGFDWERKYLSQYNLPVHLPIFITETGWAHREGKQENTSYRTSDDVADLYYYAYTHIWIDPDIVMVSPFILNYQDAPFDHFSWKKLSSNDFYPQHEKVLGLYKESGNPIQRNNALLTNGKIPTTITEDAIIFVPVTVVNNGQKIWNNNEAIVHIQIGNSKTATMALKSLDPKQAQTVKIPITASDTTPVTITSQVFSESQPISSEVLNNIEVHAKQHNLSQYLSFGITILPQLLQFL